MVTAKRVDVRIGKGAVPVGELIYEVSGVREASVFTYHASWLQRRNAFALAPDMPLRDAPFYGSRNGNWSALPLPVSDGAPDSWGRTIIRTALKDENGRGRALTDMDYLLESDDFLRSGALRYFDSAAPDAVALAPPRAVTVPRLFEMDDIIAASRAFEADPEGYQANRARLLADDLLPNAGSLGGARPKVNVSDDAGNLWIAKLAKQGDTYALARTELLALRLADQVGISVAQSELLATTAQRFPVALVRRFDRGRDGARIPFISAQTFMGLQGTEPGNYVDLAHRMMQFCEDPKGQMQELHRRLLFTVLIQNADDHLRNHGFLATVDGKWRLSPAYDINPVPEEGVTLKTAISDLHGYEMSVEAVIEAAPFFEVSEDEAARTARDMAVSISGSWRQIGASLGMTSSDFRAVAPALESRQIEVAKRLGQPRPPAPGPGMGM